MKKIWKYLFEYLAIIFTAAIILIIYSAYSIVDERLNTMITNQNIFNKKNKIEMHTIDTISKINTNPILLQCTEFNCKITNAHCEKDGKPPFTEYTICNLENNDIYLRKRFNYFCKQNESCENRILKILNLSIQDINPLNIFNTFENYENLEIIDTLFKDASRSENLNVYKKSNYYFITHHNGITIVPINSDIISIRMKPNTINLNTFIKNLEILTN